jgi:hypothetical protein
MIKEALNLVRKRAIVGLDNTSFAFDTLAV